MNQVHLTAQKRDSSNRKISNKKQRSLFHFDEETNATILIPDHLFSFYKKQVWFGRKFQQYLEYLLEHYQVQLLDIIERSQRSKTWKCTYQSPGQNLIPHSVRVQRYSWRELRELSHATGYSCCLLFTMLLLLDFKNGTVTTKRNFIFLTESFGCLSVNPSRYSSGFIYFEDGVEKKWRIEYEDPVPPIF